MGNRRVFSKYKLLYVLRNPGSWGEMKRVLIRQLAEKDGGISEKRIPMRYKKQNTFFWKVFLFMNKK